MKLVATMTRALVLVLVMASISAPAFAGSATHKVAIHVDENDAKRMNMALNNAANIDKYYQSKGEEVQIEIVAYGPGLMMYSEEKSPVKSRIAAMGLEMGNLSFSACGNTHKNMSKKAGKKMVLVSEAKIVPSGVVRLMELQEKGWSYVRP
jgi:uncharacterized protein